MKIISSGFWLCDQVGAVNKHESSAVKPNRPATGRACDLVFSDQDGVTARVTKIIGNDSADLSISTRILRTRVPMPT